MTVSRRIGVAAGALVLSLGAALLSPSRAVALPLGEDKLDFAWKYLGYSCEFSADGKRVRYVVKARMRVNNRPSAGRWASEMTFKARVVASGAGLNLPRNWSSKTYRPLIYSKRYNWDVTVRTDWVSARGDWRLQTKYIWDRPAPIRNVTRTFKSAQDMICGVELGG
jgi:hypothetical protein